MIYEVSVVGNFYNVLNLVTGQALKIVIKCTTCRCLRDKAIVISSDGVKVGKYGTFNQVVACHDCRKDMMMTIVSGKKKNIEYTDAVTGMLQQQEMELCREATQGFVVCDIKTQGCSIEEVVAVSVGVLCNKNVYFEDVAIIDGCWVGNFKSNDIVSITEYKISVKDAK